MNTRKYLPAVVFAVSAVASFPVWSESNSVTIDITARVSASCTLEVPSVVALEEIPFSALANKTAGDPLPEYATTFELKSKCIGTNNYHYTFKPTTFGGALSCLGSDTGALRFCLKVNEQNLDFQQGQVIVGGTNDITIVTVTPHVGSTLVAGVVKGAVTVTISPT